MGILDLDDDGARALFHKLTAEAAAIRAVSEPLRAARDAFVAEAQEREQDLNVEIKAAETGLFEIDQKRARIARMLGGKTGNPKG